MEYNLVSKGIRFLAVKHAFDWLPDKYYLQLKYWACLGKKLHLDNPQTFNEKLQWLKLYDRKPEYTIMVDKYEAKKYAEEKIGAEYIIPALGIWDSFDQIDFEILPTQYVLKCTHDSGGLVICKDKKNLDVAKAREKITKSLKRNYYLQSREWPYKNVKRNIIAEQYMEDNKTKELRDYKFFCFNGKAKCFKIDFNREVSHRANYFNLDGELLPVGEEVCPPDFSKQLELPDSIATMKILAEKLAENIPFVRVDFYDVNGRIYFGEMTFYPASGFGAFTSSRFDYEMGMWIELPSRQ